MAFFHLAVDADHGNGRIVGDTLGLLEECLQLVRDLGYEIREEPLGDLPGGACVVGGKRIVLVNLEHGPLERLERLVELLAGDPRVAALPKSRLLASRLAAADGA